MIRPIRWVRERLRGSRAQHQRGTLTMSAVIHRADGTTEDLGKLAEGPAWMLPGTGEGSKEE